MDTLTPRHPDDSLRRADLWARSKQALATLLARRYDRWTRQGEAYLAQWRRGRAR